MTITDPTVIVSPRLQFSTVFWGGLIALFGAMLVAAGIRENNVWYLIVGGAVGLLAFPVLIRYERTIIDTAEGVWTRRKGGMFGSESESGPLSEITQLRVKCGVDSKEKDYWSVTLVRNGARNIDWHQYTYLGRTSMEQAVAHLEAALGLTATWIGKTSRWRKVNRLNPTGNGGRTLR